MPSRTSARTSRTSPPSAPANLAEDAARTLRLLEALYTLEQAVAACPAGHRRRAAVELVVTRMRRLARPPRPRTEALPGQLDIEDVGRGKRR